MSGLSSSSLSGDNSIISSSRSSSPELELEGLKGRRIIQDPAIPTSWKVALVFVLLITATVAAVLIVATKGHIPLLHPDGLAFRVVKDVTIAIGSCQALGIASLAIYYCLAKRRQDRSEELKGRGIIQDPVIPTSWKVGLVFVLLITATVAAVLIVATKGHIPSLHPQGHTFRVVKDVTIAIGSCQALSIASLAIYYCLAKKQREQYEQRRLLEDEQLDREEAANNLGGSQELEDDEDEDQLIRTPKTHAESKPAPEPPEKLLTKDEWVQRLETAPNQGRDGSGLTGTKVFNLAKPDEKIQTMCGFYTLPAFGKYEKGRASASQDSVAAAFKLPQSKLGAFPEEIQDWFAEEKRRNKDLKTECYVMVFRNNVEAEDYRRNLFMHPAVFSDYDASNPSNIRGKRGVIPTQDGDGLKTPISMMLCDPQGLSLHHTREGSYTCKDERVRLPVKGKKHFNGSNALVIHGEIDDLPAFSPRTAEIVIAEDNEISSFSVGAIFRGKAMAFHAIIINEEDGPESKKLLEAIQQPTAFKFLNQLETDNSDYFSEINSFFQPPKAD
jgi:hypothetical protein